MSEDRSRIAEVIVDCENVGVEYEYEISDYDVPASHSYLEIIG